jgi:hypothetical protein
MTMDARPNSRRSIALSLDLSAVGLSFLCVLHCLALPALALVLPTLGAVADIEWLHLALLALAAPIALIAFVGPRAGGPRDRWMLALAVAGLALMLAAIPARDWDRPLTLAGGATLALAHLANWRRRHALSHQAQPRG